MPEVNYVQVARSALIDELGEDPHVLPHPLLVDLYTLLLLTRGRHVGRQDVHDAWSVWQVGIRPDHRSLVPYADLAPHVQEMDEKYVQVIRSAHKKIYGEGEPQ